MIAFITLAVAVAFIGFSAAVYSLYLIKVLRTKRTTAYIKHLEEIISQRVDNETLPSVTVLIPAYNEEEAIYSKLKNVSEFNYPRNNLRVFLLDDSSTDKTREIASKAFADFALDGVIIRNAHRTGVNFSYNNALSQTTSEYVLTTDVDAIIPTGSLLGMVKILENMQDVGAVAAKMLPFHNEQTASTRAADAYADSYNEMLLAESSLSSTFPGSTSCMLMRTSAFSSIPESQGSSDGNISLRIIKNGFRFLSAPNIAYYEPVTPKIFEQRRQKNRRATRLIQSMLINSDMWRNEKYGSFGRTIFPLRFAMMVMCPILLLSSVFLLFAFTAIISPLLFAITVLISILVIFLGATTSIKPINFITSFILHQVYLCAGLFQSRKKMTVWKKIERINVDNKQVEA